jgi:two-component system, OmpR family, response regulator
MPHDHDVLIVEDDDDSRDGLAALLANGDIRVRTASTGRAALGLLAAGFAPCLILLDYRMRDMDGGVFLAELRAGRGDGIPVVLITGDIEAAARTRELGVQDAVLKPIDPRAVGALIVKHCGAR